MSFLPRWWFGVFALILFFLILGFGGVLFTYGITRQQWDSPMVRRITSFVRFPAAHVGSIMIPYMDYLALMDAQRILLTTEEAKEKGLEAVPETERRRGALDALMRNAATELLAVQDGIEVTPLDVDRFYDQLVALAPTSTGGTPQEHLKRNFGWTPKQYKKYVVRSDLLRDILSQKREQAGDRTPIDDLIKQRLSQPDVKSYLQL